MPQTQSIFPPRLRSSLSLALRLGLPLGALALMSTIFLVSRSVDPNRAVALSNLDLTTLTREPRIGTARIAGVTTDNAAITISAASIRSLTDPQDNAPLTLHLDQPAGTWGAVTGADVTFSASGGQIDQSQNLVTLDRDVTLRASSGYEVSLGALHIDLNASIVNGIGPVTGTGPAGTMSAAQMTLRALPDQDGGYLLAFKGDVRLLYIPQQ